MIKKLKHKRKYSVGPQDVVVYITIGVKKIKARGRRFYVKDKRWS